MDALIFGIPAEKPTERKTERERASVRTRKRIARATDQQTPRAHRPLSSLCLPETSLWTIEQPAEVLITHVLT